VVTAAVRHARWCVISGLRACLPCLVIAGAGVAERDADGSLQDVLAAALEANERLAEGLTAENARLREENARLREENARLREENARLREENARLREENARLRERDAFREAGLERLRGELAVLRRLVFGRSSERARPTAARDEDGGARAGTWRAAGAAGRGGPGRGAEITGICPRSR
jgi:hypothetical protein